MRRFRIALNLDEAALVHAMLKHGFSRNREQSPAYRAGIDPELLAAIDDQRRRADKLVERIAKAMGQ